MIEIGKTRIQVPDSMEWEARNIVESWKPGSESEEHPFESMDEFELQCLIADDLGIDEIRVEVWRTA